MKRSRDFMRVYSVPIVLLAGILLTVVFAGFYTATARTWDGRTVAGNWPKEFTLAFSQYFILTEEPPAVTDDGKALLADNGLWLQVLDASGTEVLQYGKPAGTPDAYEPYALLTRYQYGDGVYSVFISSVSAGNAAYTYLIGFPMRLSKVVMYVDNARFRSGKALIITVAALTAVLVVTLTIYSYRTFAASRNRRRQDEKAKEEWLANITHDLKTPLAPIRGYAELLYEEESLPASDARRYGAIILKNALYTEQLVDDLKLTYQLQSNLLPVRAEARNLTRFVREVVIDILNTPEYEGRDVTFFTDREDLVCLFDAQLLRRALTNVVINALKHNRPDTQITVVVECGSGTKVIVKDNGTGMTPRELEGLFVRYYRGESTVVKAEGSGLGMAIARQIVEAHGGTISAQSEAKTGTIVTMQFPQSFKV